MSNNITRWDRKFIELAKLVATWSKDLNKVGAVIVGEDNIVLSLGYNGFPRKIFDLEERRNNRSIKLAYTVHAELNAILNAAKKGISLNGTTIYLQWFPCVECAKSIVNAGIKRVVCTHYNMRDLMRMRDYKFDYAESILTESETKIDYYE